jgi:hypothetical protein
MADRDPPTPPTPRRPVPAVTEVASNGNVRDPRLDPARTPDPDRRSSRAEQVDAAILECELRFGVIAREIGEVRREQTRTAGNYELLAGAVHGLSLDIIHVRRSLDALTLAQGGVPPPEPTQPAPVPPMRPRFDSEAELETFLETREERRLGKAVRGVKEKFATAVVTGLAALAVAGAGACVDHLLSATRVVPVPVVSPAPSR